MKQFQIARLWPILVSLLVAIVIWCWPAKPIWHTKSTDQLLGFGHDGQSVLTISTTEPGTAPQHTGDDEAPQADYFIMDARTGKRVSEPLTEVEHIRRAGDHPSQTTDNGWRSV